MNDGRSGSMTSGATINGMIRYILATAPDES